MPRIAALHWCDEAPWSPSAAGANMRKTYERIRQALLRMGNACTARHIFPNRSGMEPGLPSMAVSALKRKPSCRSPHPSCKSNNCLWAGAASTHLRLPAAHTHSLRGGNFAPTCQMESVGSLSSHHLRWLTMSRRPSPSSGRRQRNSHSRSGGMRRSPSTAERCPSPRLNSQLATQWRTRHIHCRWHSAPAASARLACTPGR